jgi:hypothetical protein
MDQHGLIPFATARAGYCTDQRFMFAAGFFLLLVNERPLA